MKYDKKNPFVGLRPFESRDSLYYFGRDTQTREFLTYLHRTRFLAVVGSSGSGKSSLVRAGLIPGLEAGFLVHDRDIWHIAKMKPGDRPLHNLADALLRIVRAHPSKDRVSHFAETIEDRGVHEVTGKISPILAKKDSNLFLLVDQFEEVFRFGVHTGDRARRDEAAAFVDLLLQLAKQDKMPVYVCITMRSDYIGDCDVFPGLPETLNVSQYQVPRLTRRQRREAIEGPMRLSGAAIAPRLLDRLLNESAEIRDDLPLLQHALMRSWNEWSKKGEGPLDIDHYEKIQTMERALSRHADEALEELSEEEKQLAKLMFQALTETDSENRRIRRSVHLDELADVMNVPHKKVMRIIKKFRADNRAFLVLSSETAADDPLVDISHESLMRQWDTLRDWMNEEAESAKIYKRLAETAELNKQGLAGLYTDATLEVAREWQEKKKPTIEWGKRYHEGFDDAMDFLTESINAHKKKIEDEEKQRIEREHLLQERADLLEDQAQQRQQSLRQTRIFSIFITILLVIVAVLAYEIKKQSDKVIDQRNASNYKAAVAFNEWAMSALRSAKEQNNFNGYKEAWLYMTAALKQELAEDKLPLKPVSASQLLTPQVLKNAFYERWISPSTDFHTDRVTSLAFSPDGKIIASGSFDQTIGLHNVVESNNRWKLKGHEGWVYGVAFSPDGKTAASVSYDKTIRLWELETGKLIRVLEGHTGWVYCIAFSPNGKILASGSYDRTIRLWRLKSGKRIRTLTGHTSAVSGIAFSPDGKTIASASYDYTIRLWAVNSGKQIRELTGHRSVVTSVAFSPNGRTIASTSYDDTIRLWEVKTGLLMRKLTGHANWVSGVAFSPDGKTIVSGSGDETVRLWNVRTGKEKRKLIGHSSDVTAVTFSPDGKTVASASDDKTIRIWEVGSAKKKRKTILTGHKRDVHCVACSSDGKTIASGDDQNVIRLWEVESGKQIRKLIGHSSDVTGVTFSPDAKTVASASYDRTIRLWEVESGKQIRIFCGHSRDVTGVAFRSDGKTIASSSYDKTIRLWDVESGQGIGILTGHSGVVSCIAFSPDGKTILSGSWDKTVRLWDTASGSQIRKFIGHTWNVNTVAFNPNGKTAASASYNADIRLWEVESGNQIRVLTGHEKPISSIVFSPDGQIIASASADQTIRLWNVESGREVLQFKGHEKPIFSVVFSPDGDTIVSGSGDLTIRLWDISIFNLFLKTGKASPLFKTFTEGAEFFWGVELEESKYEKRKISSPEVPALEAKKFRPLLVPPAPGQSKFDQILEWAEKQHLSKKD